MQYFDIIIAGAGCAGLSLLYQLLHSPLKHSSILLVDKERKQKNDHTWSFWFRNTTPFQEIIAHQWSKVRFHFPTMIECPLSLYQYATIHASDLYQHMHALIEENPNVVLKIGPVTNIESDAEGAWLTVEGQPYSTKWLFNGMLDQSVIDGTSNSLTLLQHFLGWSIKVRKPLFNPKVATLFDFRVPQHQEIRFVYMLPYSPQEALVEYTIFSNTPLAHADYAHPLREYIVRYYTSKFSITEEERGVIPMTTYQFPRKEAPHIMNIGTRGGMVKPSTGYAFQRIQHDSINICKSLVKHNNPFYIKKSGGRYLTFDAMILDLLSRRPQLAPTIFEHLFTRTPIEQVFRFLDEEQGIGENLPIMWRMPWLPFIQSYFRLKTRHNKK